MHCVYIMSSVEGKGNVSVTGKRMRKNPHGWMLAAVLLLAAAGLLAVHSHQTAAVPPEEPAQEEPSVTVIPRNRNYRNCRRGLWRKTLSRRNPGGR